MTSQPERIVEPLIVPGALDPDAVKILRRLQRYGHEAYFVGGCVRDLSLGHIPKDFDIATSARPRQIKRLFRNSRIIGRRFKLVHIQFGDKLIEVSTFRRTPRDETPFEEPDPRESEESVDDNDELDDGDEQNGRDDLLIRRDNVFGTAEEDALRRDFTINALFYDIESNEVIDYVGGTHDLEDRLVRTIGDPVIRLQEDPVRILRAIRFAARLEFSFDPDTYDAMIDYQADLVKCASPRISEELLKLLSCGRSCRSWQILDRIGALDSILPDLAAFLDRDPPLDGWRGHVFDQLLDYLEALDDLDHGRRVLSSSTLLTTLLVGPVLELASTEEAGGDLSRVADQVIRPFAARMSISRRDAFRIKQILVAQARLRGEGGNRRRKARPSDFIRREYFKDSLHFFRIESRALQLYDLELQRWTRLYYDHLKQHDREEYRHTIQTAPFGEVEDLDEDERAVEQEPSGKRRRQRRRKPPEQRNEVRQGETGEARDRPRDSQQQSRQQSGSRNDKRGERPGDRKGPGGKRRDPVKSGGDGGQRLEFDDVRSGPLRVAEPSDQGATEEEADLPVEIHWDSPLKTVGDPGPVSVILTGIDQTEKKSRGKQKRRRVDGAARELSKEVRDQPSLQAFKMTEGDPRGHEATRPMKKRKPPAEKEPRERERPFHPVEDFEWVEDLYNW